MTKKELIEVLSKYSDDKEILVRCEDGFIYDLNSFVELANVDAGEIYATEDDEEFNEDDGCVILDATT